MRELPWKCCWSLMVLFAVNCIHLISSDTDVNIKLFNEVDSRISDFRSRLVMLDGNMYFHAGRQKNISFIVDDHASIYFGEKNLNLLPELTEFQAVKEEVDKTKSRIRQLVRVADSLRKQIKLESGDVAALNQKVSSLFLRLYI
ncbi:unnamed protein product [Thelazia callipaeda]|uniref:GOLD domain-containing protein n=1 Tax=Thelazia callipaeda TaxID=103827 RepID=A0A0N5CKJ2_THECL|nr:unnamed protein product [Thelazia callipaeda]